MLGERSELAENIPARILGTPVTIWRGSFLKIEPPHDAGGVLVCTCWAWPRGDRAPAAYAPFTIAAGYLRALGLIP